MNECLIVKSSYSKLQDGQLKSNFGDMIRATVLLDCIRDNYHWITDSRAVNLLKWFVDPEKIVTFENDFDRYNFSPEMRIYNFDNYVADQELFSRIRGGKWRGYVWNGKEDVNPENNMIAALAGYNRSAPGLFWQQALVEGLGFQWRGQDYAPCRAHNAESIDIGLNWHVHPDWESKQWPKSHWKELERILSKTCSVSWQKGLDNFEQYMSWISSCRLIVTCDTLGLHLGSALRKKVVALVGPTESREFPYNRVSFLRPGSRECMPCNMPKCAAQKNCLNRISAAKVATVIKKRLTQDLRERKWD